jgi:hypothetical protein
MKRTSRYVGLDVHQATTIVSVRDRSGRVIARSILPTEETALAEFFSGMRGAVNVAFEEGTQDSLRRKESTHGYGNNGSGLGQERFRDRHRPAAPGRSCGRTLLAGLG